MFGWFKKEVKQFAITMTSFVRPGQAVWMKRDAKAYAEEGYNRNVIVFRCVDIIAKAIASVPLQVTDLDGKPLPDHPLQKLLERPNPGQGYTDWVQGIVAYRLITGNTFAEVLTDSKGVPRELWTWQPYQMKSVAGEIGAPIPRAYVWATPTFTRHWEVDQLDGHSDLMHWRTFNPLDPYWGMSPIEAAAWSIDQHNAASEWNQQQLQNQAVPPGALKVDKTLTEDQYNRLKIDIEAQTGPQNARKPLLLENGAEWTTMGLSPLEMDWLAGKKMSGQDIAGAFGVPTQVIPIEGSQTFANFEQARLALYEDTALPLLENFINTFEHWILWRYPDGDKINIEPMLDDVPALATRRKEKWDAVQTAEFLTYNEKRKALGLEEYKHENADKIWIGSGTLPLDDADPANDGLEEPLDDEDDGLEEEEQEEVETPEESEDTTEDEEDEEDEA